MQPLIRTVFTAEVDVDYIHDIAWKEGASFEMDIMMDNDNRECIKAVSKKCLKGPIEASLDDSKPVSKFKGAGGFKLGYIMAL